MESVLVTGAAGTVGSVVTSLLETAGYRVLASDVRARNVAQPTRGEIRAADLRSKSDVERITQGARLVVHTAAALDDSLSEAQLNEVNVEGTRSLYRAARNSGVETFLHMSTATMYAPGQQGALTEDAEIAPRGTHGRSKRASELALFEEAERGGPKVIVLRAAPIYGRRGRYFAASLLAVAPILRTFSPMLPSFAHGALHTFVNAEDVARALVFLLQKSPPSRSVFHVADDDPMRFGERVTETFRAYGLPSISLRTLPRLPKALRSAWSDNGLLHSATDAAMRRAWDVVVFRHGLKHALHAHISPEARSLLQDDLVLDTARIRELGFQCRYRFREGFAQTLRWYQAERWVPRYV